MARIWSLLRLISGVLYSVPAHHHSESHAFPCFPKFPSSSGTRLDGHIRSEPGALISCGVATRPDTNHRHHAIIRVHLKYLKWMAETQSEEMGSYNPNRAFTSTIFLAGRVPTTAAHYIESKTQSPHIHTRLARELMERSGILGHSNVEIMSNNLSRNSAKMVTFGTLVDSLRLAFPDLDDESYSPVLEYLVQFIAELSRIRPKEIALLSVGQRRTVRDTSVADQATLWQVYIRLRPGCVNRRRKTGETGSRFSASPMSMARMGRPRGSIS